MTPPRLALWCLEHLLDAAAAEAISGDLQEEFHAIARRAGARRARLWFWRQALLSVASRRRRTALPRPDHPRSNPMLDDLLRDVRFTLRMLARTPAFSAAAILTLAVGIGAATAIATAAHRTLLRPLPYPHGDRLVVAGHAQSDGSGRVGNVGFATVTDWRARLRSFDELSIVRGWNPTLVGEDGAEQLDGMRVNWNYFRMLGVQPALGRDFLAADDHQERWRVVLLSDGLWRRRFGARTDIAGTSIELNGRRYQVLGVLPPSFQPLVSSHFYKRAEIYAPLGYDPAASEACRTCQHLRLIGRLREGVTPDQARAELAAVQEGLRREYPSEYTAEGPALARLDDELARRVRRPLQILLLAVTFVLLVGCANVAGLLVARAIDRERELVLRAALGAGRGRLIRQLLTESLVLAAAAAALGVMVARGALALLAREAPTAVPQLTAASADPVVLAIGAGVGAAALALFGLLPAWTSSSLDLQGATGSARHTAGRRALRARELLIGGEVAVALLLVAGAGLMFRTVDRLLNVHPGFEPRGVLTMGLLLGGPRWTEDEAVRAFQDDVLGRVQGLPGVEAAALASQIPLGGNYDRWGFRIEGRSPASEADAPSVERYGVTPGYFTVMRIPLLRGRLLSSADRRDSDPVIVVGETTARTLWAGRDPLGSRVRIGGGPDPWRTVVGVVGDVRHYALGDPPTMQMYVPEQQLTDSSFVLLARVSGDPARMVPAIRREVHGLARDVPISDVATLEQRVSASVASRRFLMLLLASFAAATLVMVAVGLYGAVSQAVASRQREIGIRVALGATRADIAGLMLGRGLQLVAGGVAAGLAGALAFGRLLDTQLYGTRANDPLALALAVVALAVVAVAAHAAPLLRATRVDPRETLVAE